MKMSKPFSIASDTETPPRLLIIGDSQAHDFYNMLIEAELFRDFEIRTINVPAICQFDFSPHRFEHILPENKALCEEITLESINEMAKKADVIVVGSGWRINAINNLPTTLGLLQKKISAPLFILSAKSTQPFQLHSYISLSIAEKAKYRLAQSSWAAELNAKLDVSSENHTVIDLLDLYCDEKKQECRLFTDEGNLIFYDQLHLTQEGAKFFGKELGKTVLRAYAP
jgi:hypothetical protein